MKLGNRADRFKRFLAEDIWDVELSTLTALRRLGVRSLRVVFLMFRGFIEDECPLQASALTFSTLMSIVPVLALSFALARGFGGGDAAKAKIHDSLMDFIGQLKMQDVQMVVDSVAAAAAVATNAPEDGTAGPEAAAAVVTTNFAEELDRVINFIFEKVENVNFAALGGVGLLILLVTVVQTLIQIESSFNRVWGVANGRSVWRAFTDYLSVLVVLPILVIAATSLPVVDFVARFLDPDTAAMVQAVAGSDALKVLTVLVMTWLAFTFIITFMPNTRVQLGAGMAGGLMAALLFIGWLYICAGMQAGTMVKYGKMYGSFAILPIALLWVYVSWAIVLFGAEVAFALQNSLTYRMEQGAQRANVRSRLALALAVVREAGLALTGRQPIFAAEEFARTARVSVRLLNDVVEDLVHAGLLAEVAEKKGHFTLLRSPESLPVHDVVQVILSSGTKAESLGLGSPDAAVAKVMQRLGTGLQDSLKSVRVADLLGQA